MRKQKIDRAFLKRSLGGEYPNGPRGSWTLLNEAEGRVYFLGWNIFYSNFSYPLRDAGFYSPAEGDNNSKGLREWHDSVERVRRGELEGCVILQVANEDEDGVLSAERILDGVFFGEVVETNGELWFSAVDRASLGTARAPQQESA